jgi:hypothetical protein
MANGTQRLDRGTPGDSEAGSVSRLVGQGKADPETIKQLKKLEEMLK